MSAVDAASMTASLTAVSPETTSSAAVLLEYEPQRRLHVAVLDLERGGAPAVPLELVAVAHLDDAHVHDVLAHAVMEAAYADVLLEGVDEPLDEVPRPCRADDGEWALLGTGSTR